MRALVLPGLDGAEALRAEFAAALAPEFDATVLSYPDDAGDYDVLTGWVRERLPTGEDFVLIAESFSGPIAIRLAAMRPPGLAGVVLAVTFARAPRPRLAALRLLARPLLLRRLPMAPAMFFLMGRWSTHGWTQRLRTALAAVEPRARYRRLLAAATVDVSPLVADIECPILYLQASHDRIVPAECWRTIRDRGRNAVCIGIQGPHMLLQARPQECAAAVKR